MKVFTQSVNFTADKSLIDYIEKKIEGLEKFHDKIVDAEVYLKVQKASEKENKITEIKINIPGDEFMVKKQTKTFEEGVNIAIDSLKRSLKKSKEKQRSTLVE
ncbi:ribosome-associated translation inhibitor RaiA [Tenacibaculum finnmarkense genomovar finnmarkense]|uniref:Ribosomal subunit interface protein n=1 Tax=Tenacibaculum finnmarkense genomovar ulcerans TaxID=2781388 RepID=A0A2I2M9L7_9FLAO|nr:HPF/RaiA family ribosome-associated protein [Tenacibaculum finnmarkense]ALU75461.1 ribosomal subunit interface protein [Tenacibaculum dicentrarchi]MBE7632865.1 ribosomal subunit interface protein [Tenacibaculum finnmarkense genomovar ulcerans]MBE7644522.1 ribosomal subunit interface protein [Tenacibaculum finnmarkense genomovar ulcerans]MBE7648111.1 ribosomal subunit interface protein [Tenacibaculum finnmarkense genomovar ulcerans]MBE7659309.1 ribosomal subunit interface protein [Tenacibacu